jgi:uncharacterized membrane protein
MLKETAFSLNKVVLLQVPLSGVDKQNLYTSLLSETSNRFMLNESVFSLNKMVLLQVPLSGVDKQNLYASLLRPSYW